MPGLKAGEPTWCKNCERFFTESVQEHGQSKHENEDWTPDYNKQP